MSVLKSSVRTIGFQLICLLGLSSVVVAQPGIITTVAGTTGRGYTGDGGPATRATMHEPYGMAIDAAGNIYIADTVNQVIRKVRASDGIITTVAGNGVQGYGGDNGPALQASFNTPTGVAVDAQGNLYIADKDNDRIRKVSAANGIITTVAGSSVVGFSGDNGPATSAKLCRPYAMTLDGSGNMFIADSGNFRIRKVTSGGTISTVAGSGSATGATCNGLDGTYSGDGGNATSARLN